jgi:hypothetical protein
LRWFLGVACMALEVALEVACLRSTLGSTLIEFVPAEQECTATSYWIGNPTTDNALDEFKYNTEKCPPQPYNIEARPCSDPAKPTVFMPPPLSSTSKVRERVRRSVKATTGDVFRNLKRIPDGTYRLHTRIDVRMETITFTKMC